MMKKLWIILLTLTLFYTSCTTAEDLSIEPISFEGVYKGNLVCSGLMADENGSEIILVITEKSNETYNIDFGDDVIFEGLVQNNKFVVDKQTINEGQGFDEVTMELEIEHSSSNVFLLNLSTSVDDEGESSCKFLIVKD